MATALADALLTTDWQPGSMLRAAGVVLGRHTGWSRQLVAAVLRAYRDAPADRPRELAGFVAAVPHPAKARRTLVRRAVIRSRPVAPVRTVRMRWHLPPIDDLAALAAFLDLDGDLLDWFADRREINRRARDEPLRHYRYTWLPHRLIEAPKPRLRALQRRLLDDVLARIPVHDGAHGFVPGRGVHTFAGAHAGHPVLVTLDLRAFFSSVTAARIHGLFRSAGYPEPVAHTLTALTTTRTPAHVLRHAPDPARAALLRQPHLPQGAPTSPALANLCAYRLDRRLTGLAGRFGLHYGRYADDLAFSGALGDRGVAGLIAAVRAVTADEGFRVHPGKTRVRRRADRQRAAGLVVNASPAAPGRTTTGSAPSCTTPPGTASRPRTGTATRTSPPISPAASPGCRTAARPGRRNCARCGRRPWRTHLRADRFGWRHVGNTTACSPLRTCATGAARKSSTPRDPRSVIWRRSTSTRPPTNRHSRPSRSA